jgi:uncharacterized GH25 family protein
MKKSLPILTTIAFAVAVLLVPQVLSAHDLWSTADNPAPGKALSAAVGYGHHFPALEAIPAEEYPLFKVSVIGPKGSLAVDPGNPNYIWTTKEAVEAGSYLVVTDVTPVFWSKSPDGWSMKNKKDTPGAISCEYTVESAKGVVDVGAAGSNSAITKPVGLPIEIVPSVNPATVGVGGKIPLKVLLNGKPAAAATVNARYAGFDKLTDSTSTYAFSGVTDKDGVVNFVPLAEGEWIVKAQSEKPYADLSSCDKDSYGSTLHFKIGK